MNAPDIVYERIVKAADAVRRLLPAEHKDFKPKLALILGSGLGGFGSEIDVIAEDKDFIIFVEVKTRAYGQILEPREYVDYYKQQRILKTACLYLKNNVTVKQPRFDIAEVLYDSKGKKSVNYFENAFFQENKGYATF